MESQGGRSLSRIPRRILRLHRVDANRTWLDLKELPASEVCPLRHATHQLIDLNIVRLDSLLESVNVFFQLGTFKNLGNDVDLSIILRLDILHLH